MQYDPEGRKKRHLYYHYLDEKKTDKLITKIRKVDANTMSFKVSHDYKFLILRGSRWLSIASIKSLEREIKFDLLFKFSQDITYVSVLYQENRFIGYFDLLHFHSLYSSLYRITLEMIVNFSSSSQTLEHQSIM